MVEDTESFRAVPDLPNWRILTLLKESLNLELNHNIHNLVFFIDFPWIIDLGIMLTNALKLYPHQKESKLIW